MDSAVQHTNRSVLMHAGRLGLHVILVPAGFTWLLQPSETSAGRRARASQRCCLDRSSTTRSVCSRLMQPDFGMQERTEAFAQAIVDSNAWSCLSDSDKERWLKGATDAFAGNMAERQSRKGGRDAAHADGVEDNSFFRSFGARYIWNGPWLADSMVLRGLVQQFRGAPDELIAQVCELCQATALLDPFWHEMLDLKALFVWPQKSCCLERAFLECGSRLPHALSHVCSNSRPTQLSQSQCNESDYTVQLFRVPMIVTSNNFSSGCDDATARDWIEKNSFLPLE